MSVEREIELHGGALDARLDQAEAELAEIETRRFGVLRELAEIKRANSQLSDELNTYIAEKELTQ